MRKELFDFQKILHFQAGASASFFNHKLGCAPVHVAAEEGEPEKMLLLLQVFT